ncbi:MAG: S9 family peptidase, partial [Alistipes sp.]|nr:S9 family peptidase [Alistipes sp.]
GAFIKTLLTEKNDRWIEPQNPIRFIDNDRFIYTTDNRDGYKNLYLYTLSKGTIERLTKVDADVAYVAHNDRAVYYYSAEISPVERHLFSVSLRNGKAKQLTRGEGWHNCEVSTDGLYFTDNYSSLNVPRVVAVGSTDGKIYREVFRAEDPSKGYNYSTIELGSVKSTDGKYNNHYRLIKPLDFDENKKYPVILYVYGGPHSQMVTNSFQAQLRRWEMYMAQRGYVVFVMDNRGTLNQGAEYEKAIHRQCGKCEMEDQMAGLQWLLSHKWADKERVGVHGWSYGGFMTISLMTHYPEVFKVGVAGGPVIDWKWYEVMYGERYMETEKRNPEGFAATSLIPQAKNLKGKLLICQGVIDDVVVWQHSLSFVDACICAGVPVDYFPYPRSKHNVRGKWRVHLMQKVTDYFEDYLR